MEIENCFSSSAISAISATGIGAAASSTDVKARLIIREFLRLPATAYATDKDFNRLQRSLAQKYKALLSKRQMLDAYRAVNAADPAAFPWRAEVVAALQVRAVRSASGIVNISVVTPPGPFSCKYNCKFCPAEPGMPRSYLSNEDAVARGARVDFDAVRQTWSRFDALEANGHTLDKIEFRILGGTFSCYPHDVADVFIRDLYYAANTYYDAEPRRVAESMEAEQTLNVGAAIHVVGLGVETRPDEVTLVEILRFRRYGVTRVELGVQHTNDELLRGVNRGHGVAASRRAIALLKDYGFKVEIHIMADLPGATPQMDKDCYWEVLRGAGGTLIPDYLKDYPCLDVAYTALRVWKAEGKWKPYAEATPDARALRDVLVYRQSITPPFVRVNRIQRDFRQERVGCAGYVSSGIPTNLAQLVKEDAEACGIFCQCIRCCEIRDESFRPEEVKYRCESFEASGGREWFLSAVVQRQPQQPQQPRPLLLGFLRLRVSAGARAGVVPALHGRCAMIRELHVYGPVTRVGTANNVRAASRGAQHLGIGRELMRRAEWIALGAGCWRMAVISGIGVRGYYGRIGFVLEDTYMIKNLVYYRVTGILAVILTLWSIVLVWMKISGGK